MVSRAQKMQEKIRKIAAIQRRIHPNAWDNLKQDPPERFKHHGLAISIKDKFPEHIIEYLKHSFGWCPDRSGTWGRPIPRIS